MSICEWSVTDGLMFFCLLTRYYRFLLFFSYTYVEASVIDVSGSFLLLFKNVNAAVGPDTLVTYRNVILMLL